MDLEYLQTPCYVFDKNVFTDNVSAFRNVFYQNELIVGYSFKTNHNDALLQTAKELGMYAEVVSIEEYKLAKKAGFSLEHIIVNGPAKPIDLMIESINAGQIINLDSLSEIYSLIEHANDIKQGGAVGIRVNFNLEKDCPGETTAGDNYSRFGISIENDDFITAVKLLHDNGIRINSIHMHYSTKTRSVKVFDVLSQTAVKVILENGLIDEIKYIDIGGGFFYGNNIYSDGRPRLKDYANVIEKNVAKLGKKIGLIIEPGASIISTSIKYYSRVLDKKKVSNVLFCTIDGSLLHINPLLQSRKNAVEIIAHHEGTGIIKKQVLCGHTCMELDRLAEFNDCEELEVGDMVECDCAGAYTVVYNSFFINTPPYVYIKCNEEIKMIRGKDYLLMERY